MTEAAKHSPAERTLHSVHRGILSVLIAVASVLMLLWLVDTWANEFTPPNDVTWFVSSGIRFITFLASVLLSFLATYRSQPPRTGPGGSARPTASSVRLRVVAAACAALFFGDLAASSIAQQEGSWVTVLATALLAMLTLFAVISVGTGRVVLRYWRDAQLDAPNWNELTEAEVNRLVPAIGAQTAWLCVFLVAWLLASDLPPIVPLATPADSRVITLILESTNITAVGIAHYVKRELTISRIPSAPRMRLLDTIMAVLGTMMSAEVGIRTILVYGDLPPIGFWLSSSICTIGLVAGSIRFLRSVQSQL